MDMPDRIREPLARILPLIAIKKLVVLVDVSRNYIEVKAFRRLRLTIHEQRQTLRTGITQPLLDGETIALRLGNFLALLIKEQLVIETLGCVAAQRPTDLAR